MFGKHKKELLMLITVTRVFIGNRVWPVREAAASGLGQTDQAYVIQIVHPWTEPTSNGPARQSRLSHGTAIGPHTLLTHNDFARPAYTASGETITFVNVAGHSVTLNPGNVILEPIDGGTLLIYLLSTVTLSGAPMAARVAVEALGFGDWLTVSYWDDAASRHAQQDFMILYVTEGVATVFDPSAGSTPVTRGAALSSRRNWPATSGPSTPRLRAPR